MKRLLVTGASGFIGRNCLTLLPARGYEVHAVSSKPREGLFPDIEWYQCDLLSRRQIRGLLSKVQPTHLLHFAWHVAPGKWATSGVTENFLWVQSSLELLRSFYQHGGKRVVMVGSCTEYDWSYGYCSEFLTPKKANTFYGTCKNALHTLFDAYSHETGLSSAWGRIFFVYGPHEHPARLVSSVIRSLLRGEPAYCTHGNQIRDYLYVQDVADAFIALLESNVSGPVNIASGRPIALKDIVHKIAQKLNQEDLIQLGALPTPANETPVVIADVGRLFNELGWQPLHDWDRGLELTIRWWKDQVKST